MIDFSKYSQKDFLFTPYKYAGEYNSIGLISITFMPQAKLKESYTFKESGTIKSYKKGWGVGIIDLEKALDTFYQKAISMEADAVVDFEIKYNIREYDQKSTYPVTIIGLELSGFAIKRIKK